MRLVEKDPDVNVRFEAVLVLQAARRADIGARNIAQFNAMARESELEIPRLKKPFLSMGATRTMKKSVSIFCR